MARLSFILSLMTDKNAYQRDQAAAAKEVARRMDVDLQVFFAESDAVTQSEQLLKAIQSPEGSRPNGIVCQPIGTPLERVAREAATRGIGWALINREADYLSDLRRLHNVPAFSIILDQEEIGRIQGRQFAALLPNGGNMLYIIGPSMNPVFKLRQAGMHATKPENIQVITLRGALTEESGYQAVSSWLRLPTSRTKRLDLIASQNDDMTVGARRAFEETLGAEERGRWTSLPYTGCDACKGAGADWIRVGTLTASVFLPPTAGLTLETLVRAIEGKTLPPLRRVIAPESRPPLEQLVELGLRSVAVPR